MYDISGTLQAKIFSETSNLTFARGSHRLCGIPVLKPRAKISIASSYFVVKGMVK